MHVSATLFPCSGTFTKRSWDSLRECRSSKSTFDLSKYDSSLPGHSSDHSDLHLLLERGSGPTEESICAGTGEEETGKDAQEEVGQWRESWG